ncbi:MAG: ATP-binding cassette domain-containing protein [Victivallaceae bacterium]
MNKIEPVIEICNANVHLGGTLILKDFNWRVEKGAHWFILGANGAGKTTLVKTLMGYAWPVFGAKVKVLGNTYGQANLSEVRKKIAWVSPFMQQWTSSDWTALQMVISGLDATLGLFRKPTPDEISKALQVMKKLNCAKLAEHSMDAMSSGEQVKILICRALMHDPELMILDEACVHLDLCSREFLLKTIEELARREDSPTIIFITQRIEDITPVFERGMILREGRIVATGSRTEILTEDNLLKTFGMKVRIMTGASGRLWPILE